MASWTSKKTKTIYRNPQDNTEDTDTKVACKKSKPMKPDNSARTLFSVHLIGAMMHSNETKSVCDQILGRKRSEFFRKVILDFAKKHDFSPLPNDSDKPEYINMQTWQKVIDAQIKSHYVDFSYVIAFYYLLSLPKFQLYTKSELMREIIISHQE